MLYIQPDDQAESSCTRFATSVLKVYTASRQMDVFLNELLEHICRLQLSDLNMLKKPLFKSDFLDLSVTFMFSSVLYKLTFWIDSLDQHPTITCQQNKFQVYSITFLKSSTSKLSLQMSTSYRSTFVDLYLLSSQVLNSAKGFKSHLSSFLKRLSSLV